MQLFRSLFFLVASCALVVAHRAPETKQEKEVQRALQAAAARCAPAIESYIRARKQAYAKRTLYSPTDLYKLPVVGPQHSFASVYPKYDAESSEQTVFESKRVPQDAKPVVPHGEVPHAMVYADPADGPSSNKETPAVLIYPQEAPHDGAPKDGSPKESYPSSETTSYDEIPKDDPSTAYTAPKAGQTPIYYQDGPPVYADRSPNPPAHREGTDNQNSTQAPPSPKNEPPKVHAAPKVVPTPVQNSPVKADSTPNPLAAYSEIGKSETVTVTVYITVDNAPAVTQAPIHKEVSNSASPVSAVPDNVPTPLPHNEVSTNDPLDEAKIQTLSPSEFPPHDPPKVYVAITPEASSYDSEEDPMKSAQTTYAESPENLQPPSSDEEPPKVDVPSSTTVHGTEEMVYKTCDDSFESPVVDFEGYFEYPDYFPVSDIFVQDNACVLAPESNVGPKYRAERHPIRQNIAEFQDGLLLLLDIGVIDVETCKPLPDVLVDLWQANATGFYSEPAKHAEGERPEDFVDDEVWLRGAWPTDSNGVAQFTTIYPGYYPLRAPHIHTKVFTDWSILPPSLPSIYPSSLPRFEHTYFQPSRLAHVGQFFFSEDLNLIIDKMHPYVDNPVRNTLGRTRNIDDALNIFNDSLGPEREYNPVFKTHLIGNVINQGLIGFITMGINASASY